MLWLACLNLFGVLKGITPRATMRVAPNEPQNDGGFTYEPILVSGSSLGHCAVHVISCQRSQNQLGNLCTAIRCCYASMAAIPALKLVLRAAIAHAIRANLLANAHATTLECRRASIWRVQLTNGPEFLSS